MKTCKNSRPCSCTFECGNHFRHHRDFNESISGCFFFGEAGVTYYRSIEALARDEEVIK